MQQQPENCCKDECKKRQGHDPSVEQRLFRVEFHMIALSGVRRVNQKYTTTPAEKRFDLYSALLKSICNSCSKALSTYK